MLRALRISRETWREYKLRPEFVDAIRDAELLIEDAWNQQLLGPGASGPPSISRTPFSDALGIVEKLTLAGRREYFAGPSTFPVFFAYYFPEYIKYPFADFHFRMFADVVLLRNGDIRELAWIMFRESAKTSIAKALIVYLIATNKRRYLNVDSFDKTNAEMVLLWATGDWWGITASYSRALAIKTR